MTDILNHLGLRYISLEEAEIKIEVTFMAGSEIKHSEDVYHIIKILEADTGVALIIEEIKGTIVKVQICYVTGVGCGWSILIL